MEGKHCNFNPLTLLFPLQGKDGLVPARQSASTMVSSTTSSSSVGSLAAQRAPAAAAATSGAAGAGVGGSSGFDFGQEQEVFSLLIVDQHTFEVLHAHQVRRTKMVLQWDQAKLRLFPSRS